MVPSPVVPSSVAADSPSPASGYSSVAEAYNQFSLSSQMMEVVAQPYSSPASGYSSVAYVFPHPAQRNPRDHIPVMAAESYPSLAAMVPYIPVASQQPSQEVPLRVMLLLGLESSAWVPLLPV